jgi:protease PrsW
VSDASSAPWFYADAAAAGGRAGPVDLAALRILRDGGRLTGETIVWQQGVDAGMPLGAVLALHASATAAAGAAAASSATAHGSAAAFAPTAAGVATTAAPHRGMLASIGGKLSEMAGVPEIGDVPVGHVLTGGLSEHGANEDIFAVGTATTTPPLSEVVSGWPRPRVWWRILLGAIVTYLLLRMGITEFDNANFLPGLVVIGSFVVPLSVVVFFFEMNTPRNVSIYQIGKMMLLGGTAGLLLTMLLSEIIPGSGTGKILPALLTGAIEESGKALALLLVLRQVRWRWQLNGLLFGAAVGAGFAGFESAGYALQSRGIFNSILWRGLLSPGGHVIWTAMIGAALWQARGEKPFSWELLRHPVVVRRWIVAVVLHGLWDTELLRDAPLLQYGVLLVIGWYLTFAILKQALGEVSAAQAAGAGATMSSVTSATATS